MSFADAYTRSAQATAFRELRQMVAEHGIDFVQQSVAEIEGEIADCTCRARPVRPTDISPPEVTRDRNCPVHSGYDPDVLRDRQRDDKMGTHDHNHHRPAPGFCGPTCRRAQGYP